MTSRILTAKLKLLALIGIPFAVTILILFFCPNFDSKIERQQPLGSDFLNEWVGGHIWLSENSRELYSRSHYRAVQHDRSVVGFDWPNDRYYPMVYPPFYYVLVSPLATLPYRVAIAIWMLMLAAISAVTIFCFTRFYEPAKRHWGKCLVGMFAFCPLLISLTMAQKSVLLLFVLTATWLLLYHRQPFKSGLVFGLIAFKPHLGILIGVAILLKGQWRFVGGCLATVAALVGLSFFAGPDLCRDYFQQCMAVGEYSQYGGYQFAQSHNISGAVAVSLGLGTTASQAVIAGLSLAVIAMLFFALRGTLDFRSQRFAWQFSLLIIATILLSPHFYIYDLTLMLLPISLIALGGGNGRGFSKHWSMAPGFSVGLPVLFCVVFFVIAGMSETIALKLHFQPSLLILLALAFSLAISAGNIPQIIRRIALTS